MESLESDFSSLPSGVAVFAGTAAGAVSLVSAEMSTGITGYTGERSRVTNWSNLRNIGELCNRESQFCKIIVNIRISVII